MGKPWQPYVVKQGDHLYKLAYLRGVDPEQVWSNPLNKTLASQRKTGAILHPGDILYLPVDPPPAKLDVNKGTSNSYKADVPKVGVSVRLALDPKGKRSPANQPFEVRGAGPKPVKGTTDGDGVAHFEVPILVHEVELHFDKLGIVLPVRVGGLDPITERSGQKQRLQGLGYYHATGSEDEGQLSRAFARFQTDKGLPSTGAANDDTLDALIAAYGS